MTCQTMGAGSAVCLTSHWPGRMSVSAHNQAKCDPQQQTRLQECRRGFSAQDGWPVRQRHSRLTIARAVAAVHQTRDRPQCTRRASARARTSEMCPFCSGAIVRVWCASQPDPLQQSSCRLHRAAGSAGLNTSPVCSATLTSCAAQRERHRVC